MATIPSPNGIQCGFKISYGGQCTEVTDNGLCDEHGKLKCAGCGQQATKDCDSTMGPATCGAPLCNNCIGVMTNEGHIHTSVQEAQRIRQAEENDEAKKRASRTNEEQRKDEDGNPLNLFELLKNPKGYSLTELWYLELDHGLMGFFPAIVDLDELPKNKQMIMTSEKRLAKDIWRLLERRRSKLAHLIGYVGNGVAYPGARSSAHEMEEIIPLPHMTRERFSALLPRHQPESPVFDWRFGLVGGGNLDEDEFAKMIERA